MSLGISRTQMPAETRTVRFAIFFTGERLRVITVKDIAWLAGILEGEGSFSACGPHGGSPMITLRMSDRDVVERVAFLLDGNMTGPHQYNLARKPMWSTTRNGAIAVSWMLTLYPLMGERRKVKIRECIERWRAARKMDRRRKENRI